MSFLELCGGPEWVLLRRSAHKHVYPDVVTTPVLNRVLWDHVRWAVEERLMRLRNEARAGLSAYLELETRYVFSQAVRS